jgi:signal transduction histidine kinase
MEATKFGAASRTIVWLWRAMLSLLLILGTQGVAARTLLLQQADATVTTSGTATQSVVALPYHWDKRHGGQAGEGLFELQFDLDSVPTVSYGMYLPRLGNAYAIWLNGHLMQHNGDLERGNGADFAKGPQYVDITPGLLQLDNQLVIRIRADVGRRGGLAPVTVGPESEVRPLYRSDNERRITGSAAVAIANLLVALIALSLWATQVDNSRPGKPQRDPLYLFAGLAELSWALRVADAAIEQPPLAWPWWGMLTIAALTVWVCSMVLFCVEVAGWRRLASVSWLQRWMAVLMATSLPAGYLAMVPGIPIALTLQYAALAITALVFLGQFLIRTRLETLQHKIVAAAILLNIAVGIRDLVAFRISESYGGNTWMRYSSLMFGMALAYIVLARLHHATTQARDLLTHMGDRIARKEAELQLLYPRMEQFARDHERSAERSRILRDMHDGVGSHISTAIRQLQNGKASHDDMLRTLRDALDQLKLSIDSMHLLPGDVGALLANMRYRLESRILACGIELQWDVEELKPITRLDTNAMGQLQFMLFEAFSNVLQHAQASMLRVAAIPLGPGNQGLQLQIIDNGVGYDIHAPMRNGLRSMQNRAQAIGVALRLSSEPGRSVVEIRAN